MPWSSFDAGLETRAGFRPRGDRVTGNRVARGPWCARTRAPPGGGRVARGRAVGKRQGHPWTDGRSGTGSRVDGRSKTGSPADVPGSPVDGRTDGRPWTGSPVGCALPADRPPSSPLSTHISAARRLPGPPMVPSSLPGSRLRKANHPRVAGARGGGRRWLAQWAIARPILNRSRSQHFSDHQPPHGGRPHTQVRRVCGGGDRCVGQYGSEPTSSWRRSCPSVLPPFPWGLRVNLPVSAVEPQPSLRERRATLSAPLCRETLPRSAGRGERGSKGQQTHLLPSNGLMPPPPCA